MSKIKDGFLLREVAGNYIVVPVGAASVDFNGMITLNEVGAFLWERLNEGATTGQLCDAVIETYDISREQANKDILDFMNRLSEADLLEEMQE